MVHSSGASMPGYFDELPLAEFERLMKINYLGSVIVARAVVPVMKQQRSGGHICFVSSMAGQSGIIGYTAYAPSKFAVRGFAECLDMELKPHNILISVCNPPDVDTPMFKAENEFKPKECALISEGASLFTPEAIADGILATLENWRFFINYGFDGSMLALLACGTAPVTSLTQAATELFGLGPIRAISYFYRLYYNRIVTKHFPVRLSRQAEQKEVESY